MKIVHKTGLPESRKSELLVLPLYIEEAATKSPKAKKPTPWAGVTALSRQMIEHLEGQGHEFDSRMLRLKPKLAPGCRFELPLGQGSIRFTVLADKIRSAASAGFDDWRKVGGDALKAGRQQKARTISIALYGLDSGSITLAARAIAEGACLAAYEYRRYKSEAAKTKHEVFQVEALELYIDSPAPAGLNSEIDKARVLGDAVHFARDLVNAPPSDLTPSGLVEAARKIVAAGKQSMQLKVLDRKALHKLGAHALLAVAKGSEEPPFLIHISYRGSGGKSEKKRVVLVGKGVTFDSGGLSIKTRPGMEDMKCDMAGAACVLGFMSLLTRLKGASAIKHDIDMIIPAAENMISGQSVKPGDVVTAVNGKTIEILNTDAEGRLLLADAFGYVAPLKADMMIDFATLTGAVVAAVGEDYAGLFCDDEDLRTRLLAAGAAAGEKAWWLPLAAEYHPLIESTVADLRNSSTGPGAVTAALFLKEFVPDGVPWAHLDIAGPAYVSKANEYIPKGGTGYGIATLLRLLEQ